ncbi:MAG: helix-turn-helix domain-containing protein [Burkholderiales bacterium]
MAEIRAVASIIPIVRNSAQDKKAAIVVAYTTVGYSYQQIADYFGVHFTTVERFVQKIM